MIVQVLLGALGIVAALEAREDFEPLDPFCLNSAKLLICSKYHRYKNSILVVN